ncbi:hypothetical protein ASE98_05520 [Pseudomonas sp. Leaf48]|nr:hypothetical protein ASE98_05520 [Pseudomonas sp. Leaf48]
MRPMSIGLKVGLTLKIYNYELLYFHAKLNPAEKIEKSSILKNLEDHAHHRQFDFNKNELSKSLPLSREQASTHSTTESLEQQKIHQCETCNENP